MRMRIDMVRRGFSLLEVLVGLLVLALALIALTRTAATQVQSFAALRERSLAGWLAADVLAETRIASGLPPTGRSDGRRRFANRDWRFAVDVQATDVPSIRRIDVRVYTADDANAAIAEVTGFAGQELQP
ncbi:MAG TPA: type II secretion system minor pseudopilin GspI [Rudaea sp.]|nr:type II secretion system minor pseudopilin GspI [Rudaea sp.]